MSLSVFRNTTLTKYHKIHLIRKRMYNEGAPRGVRPRVHLDVAAAGAKISNHSISTIERCNDSRLTPPLRRRRTHLRACTARHRGRSLAPDAPHTATAPRAADARRPRRKTRAAGSREDGEGVSPRRARSDEGARAESTGDGGSARPAPLRGICAATARAAQARRTRPRWARIPAGARLLCLQAALRQDASLL